MHRGKCYPYVMNEHDTDDSTFTLGSHWDQAYTTGQQTEERTLPSDLALQAAEQLDAGDTVLELGCGVGIDAACLAGKAGAVTAVDLADSQIRSNQHAFELPNLTFQAMDIARGLGRFADGSFSAVFARRSLHYFDDATTAAVFREIYRVLQPGGRLFFECKSADDPRAGQQANVGDVRQFFGDKEFKAYLKYFVIEAREERPLLDFFGYPSKFVTCQARKK